MRFFWSGDDVWRSRYLRELEPVHTDKTPSFDPWVVSTYRELTRLRMNAERERQAQAKVLSRSIQERS